MKKLFNILTYIVLVLIVLSFLFTNNLLLGLLAIVISYFIAKDKRINNFTLFIIIISLIIRMLTIILMNIPQVTDYYLINEAAMKFANNDLSFVNDSYFSMWPYQLGFTLYEGLIYKIIPNIWVLKILNIIYSTLTVLLIYKISKKFTTERASRMVSLLYMILPLPLLLNITLNNHILSGLLILDATTFLIKKKTKKQDYIIASILIALANIIRPESIIIVFSLFIFLLIKTKKKTFKTNAINYLIFIVIYLIITIGTSKLLILTNFNKDGLTNTNPTWKFVLGTNHETCGHYSYEDEVNILGNKELQLETIKERVSDPVKLASLATCKINNYWTLSDFDTANESYNNKKIFNIDFNYIKKQVISINSVIYLTTLLMAIIGIIKYRKDMYKNNSILFVIMMVVTFFVYLLIEIQARYTYFNIISIFIISSYGYEYIFKLIDKKKED
ncbi:MAG: glycosyltransferase family 39 protein [Firmicutes bacterium]|nr:glycosyltransferase family 39 protein [Bacillota bacterium]